MANEPINAKPKLFKCDVCGATKNSAGEAFNTPQRMGAHKRYAHGAGKAKVMPGTGKGTFPCDKCKQRFDSPQERGKHRWFQHHIPGATKPQHAKTERNLNRNGYSPHIAHEAEIDPFELGHICAQIQALIAHRSERIEVPTELLTSRIVAFLSASPLRKRGRPRSAV